MTDARQFQDSTGAGRTIRRCLEHEASTFVLIILFESIFTLLCCSRGTNLPAIVEDVVRHDVVSAWPRSNPSFGSVVRRPLRRPARSQLQLFDGFEVSL